MKKQNILLVGAVSTLLTVGVAYGLKDSFKHVNKSNAGEGDDCYELNIIPGSDDIQNKNTVTPYILNHAGYRINFDDNPKTLTDKVIKNNGWKAFGNTTPISKIIDVEVILGDSSKEDYGDLRVFFYYHKYAFRTVLENEHIFNHDSYGVGEITCAVDFLSVDLSNDNHIANGESQFYGCPSYFAIKNKKTNELSLESIKVRYGQGKSCESHTFQANLAREDLKVSFIDANGTQVDFDDPNLVGRQNFQKSKDLADPKFAVYDTFATSSYYPKDSYMCFLDKCATDFSFKDTNTAEKFEKTTIKGKDCFKILGDNIKKVSFTINDNLEMVSLAVL